MEHLVFISHSSKDAPVAQLICHRLEEEGVRCWIAPRDIVHGDWAGEIMDGLSRADVCVVIIGEHAVTSPEITKEITEATRTCSYIIPFKVDMVELSPKMRYHLGPCHWLDASTPPLEERVQELIARIRNLSKEDAVYQNQRQMKLVSRMSWPRPLFLGREPELAELADRLPEERVLFLRGMGGIGKSEIAKSYAKMFQDRYDTMIFMGYQGSVLDLVCGDGITIENLPPQDVENESAEQYFARKMEAFRRLCGRTLLILDNYDVDEDPCFPELANAGAHLLVTTRNEHEDYGSMEIEPISDFAVVRELFAASYGRKIKPEEIPAVDELIRLVGCHTMTVELVAKQMKASRRKAADMLALLKAEGLKTGLKEKIRREGEESGSAFDYISRLFTISGLAEEEKSVLRDMCMVPFTGIDIGLFYDICQLESYDEINTLIAHSWLRLDEDTDVLSMHPVVADVVRARLAPSVENCKEYIAGLWREVGSLWFNTREERAKLWPLYAHLIDRCFDPIPELFTPFSYLANNAWICGRYRLSIETGHRFLDYVKRTFPDDGAKLGVAACYLGGCYHNSGDDRSAAPFYEEGLAAQLSAISGDSTPEEWDELSNSYQKVGRCAYLAGEFDKALAHLEESVRILTVHKPESGNLGNAFLELDRACQAMGDDAAALSWCDKAQAVYVRLFGEDNPNSACVLTDVGRCSLRTGQYERARQALEDSLRMNIAYNGPLNRQTFWAKEALADLAAAQGKAEEARGLYEELEAEMEQAFGEQNPDLMAIREKLSREP